MLQLSAEQMSEREQRRTEIEQTFDYDGYQVARRELFAHLRDPAIIIRGDSITFNTACIAGLEDVVYINIMFNSELKRIVVKGCNENDRDALRWCVAKPDKRKSRKMSCRLFSELLYKEMDCLLTAAIKSSDIGLSSRVKPSTCSTLWPPRYSMSVRRSLLIINLRQ